LNLYYELYEREYICRGCGRKTKRPFIYYCLFCLNRDLLADIKIPKGGEV